MANSKKDFTAEAAGVFVDKMITPEAPQPTTAKKPAAQRTPDIRTRYMNKAQTETKVTFMIDTGTDDKLRYIAFAERCKQKQIINAALQKYIADYEKKHGKIE